MDSEKRKILHLSAVFACNFTNRMYAIAEKILKENQLPFHLLFPLIEETAHKIKTTSPLKTQTGPAVRGDKKIMSEQLKMLSNDKLTTKLYRLISKSIFNETN